MQTYKWFGFETQHFTMYLIILWSPFYKEKGLVERSWSWTQSFRFTSYLYWKNKDAVQIKTGFLCEKYHRVGIGFPVSSVSFDHGGPVSPIQNMSKALGVLDSVPSAKTWSLGPPPPAPPPRPPPPTHTHQVIWGSATEAEGKYWNQEKTVWHRVRYQGADDRSAGWGWSLNLA